MFYTPPMEGYLLDNFNYKGANEYISAVELVLKFPSIGGVSGGFAA